MKRPSFKEIIKELESFKFDGMHERRDRVNSPLS